MTTSHQHEPPIRRPQSEIARLRQQITEEYEAANRGLTGLAQGTSRHCFMAARMTQVGHYRTQLVPLVGEQEATRMMGELYVQTMEPGDAFA
jgi:hypothetical protein